MDPSNNDDMDLIDFFLLIWDGRWIIAAITSLTILLASVIFSFTADRYASKLVYSVSTIPTDHDNNVAALDFQQIFYSASVFKNWREVNTKTLLGFEDFSATTVVDGVEFSRSQDDSLLAFPPMQKGKTFILARTNELSILDETFKYANYVNDLLADKYRGDVERNIERIRGYLANSASPSADLVKELSHAESFLVSLDNGATVLTIHPPTIPTKVSLQAELMFAMSIILGVILSLTFILGQNSIRQRKRRSN